MTARRTTTESLVDPGSPVIEKRQAIIDAARDLFTTVGYEAATIADVAGRAGVAVGTVYLYFKNKNDLLFAVRGDWDMEVLTAITRPELAAIPHHLRTRPLLEATFDVAAQHTGLVQLLGIQPEMVGQFYGYAKEVGLIQGAIEAFYAEAQASGSFRKVDPHAAAIITYGMVEHALCQCFEVEGGKNRQLYIDTLVDALERWLIKPEYLSGRA